MKRILSGIAITGVAAAALFAISNVNAAPPPPVVGVVGPAPEGQNAATNPVPTGVKDPAGKIRTMSGSDGGVMFVQDSSLTGLALTTQLPASLGIKTAAASVSAAPASDAIFASKIAERSDEVHCYVATTATTSTQITGCEVQSGKNFYITQACIGGDILSATATPFKLQSGTSTDCTGAHVLWSGWHPALTTYCTTLPSPLKVTVSEGLCILDATTGSKAAMVSGFVK